MSATTAAATAPTSEAPAKEKKPEAEPEKKTPVVAESPKSSPTKAETWVKQVEWEWM